MHSLFNYQNTFIIMSNKKFTSQSLYATRKNATGDTRHNATGDNMRTINSHVHPECTDPDQQSSKNATFKSSKVIVSAKQAFSSPPQLETPGNPEKQTAKLATYMILLCFLSFLLLCLMGCAGQKAYIEPQYFNQPPKNITYIT